MKKISMLMPTRERFDLFCGSINSLFENCENVDNFEVLVALDNDDIDTINKIKNFIIDKPNIKIFLFERQYYRGLNHYYNELTTHSSGEYLFLWNDDSKIISKNWDSEILNHQCNLCVLNPKVYGSEEYINTYHNGLMVLFPIIPRKWFDITGEWSHVPAVDSWIDILGKRLNNIKNLDNLIILHDRHGINGIVDNTYNDIVNDRQNHSNLFNIGFPEIWEEHYQKLLAYTKLKK